MGEESAVRAEEIGKVTVEIEKLIATNNANALLEKTTTARRSKTTKGPSIYRVPDYIKKTTNPDAYRPHLVSLGPFHHGDKALLGMEAHKHRAVAHMVKRSGKPLREFMTAVKEVAQQLRGAYENLDKKWHEERFVELMVIDGCFLLEIMRTFRAFRRGGEVVDYDDYGPDEPIFSKHGYLYLRCDIMSDMLTLENQVPLLLLQTLWHVMDPEKLIQEDGLISKRVLEFFGPLVAEVKDPLQGNEGIHPLDVVQRSVGGNRRQCRESAKEYSVMPCASDLHEAGIYFKLSPAPNGFVEAVWTRRTKHPADDPVRQRRARVPQPDGIRAAPPGRRNDVTEFVYLMDNLVDTAEDVALLKSKGIIKSGLGSDEAVVNLINMVLTRGAVMSRDSSLRDVLQDANAHRDRTWNKWRASLIHTYFSNPWVFISLVAAIILLVATLLQTAYTVVPFYQNK
ncbi:Os11g0540900 [Oryza sativa Japonica Group]|uniref:Os11g0540900 protein n=1 Tax=Oryza sativa subsp. japonica TaxID=39947 RepID=C7J8M9_ORYSJ|nr:Os11g0540900 [Oryza sativa Japonica Group]|eukprot:NP_001176583.1 Os11g0540900 [Oryza sativa Japonica Group]